MLLVILHAQRSRGGAETYTLDLLHALRQRGHDALVAATSFDGAIPESQRRPINTRGATRTGRYRAFCREVARLQHDERFDLVHAMLPIHKCDLYHPHAGLAAAAVRQKPVQAILNPRRREMARVERELFASSRPPIVLCLSDYVKSEIRAHLSIRDERLATLFNAVDLDRFPLIEAPVEPADGLIIAQDFARKGVAHAIAALARPEAKGVRLTVVGRDDPERYRALARRLGVGDFVRFVGPTSDVRPYYRDAGFFVLPTHHDPCSLVVLEALASGVPVISTRFNGACEVMTDGVHGFVLPRPDDIAALAGAIGRVVNPHVNSSMRRACRVLRPKLSYQAHVEQLESIYARAR